MDVSRILAEIDAEIAKLNGVRATLSGLSGSIPGVVKTGRRGRPKGSKNAVPAKSATPVVKKTKRTLSPEARKRIADAQKRRWAESRKEQPKK